jgi:hypothetical protein
MFYNKCTQLAQSFPARTVELHRYVHTSTHRMHMFLYIHIYYYTLHVGHKKTGALSQSMMIIALKDIKTVR